MEEDEIKEQAKKDAKDLWEKELEMPFIEKINESLLLMMKNIDSQFLAYEKKFNSIIKGIDKNAIDNSSQNSVQKPSLSSSNISNNNNPNKINIKDITKPYTKLTFFSDENPLINLIIQCLCNIKTFMAYYFNPDKEEKILRKFKNNPNDLFLGPAYLNLLKKVWEDQKEEYSAIEIHNVLKGLMKDDYNSNNSGHIMKFIIKQLYSELNDDNDQVINLDNFTNSTYLPKNKILYAAYPYIQTKKSCLTCRNIVQNYFSVSPVINIYLDENNGESTKFNLENDLNKLLIERGEEQILDDCQICKKQQNIMVTKSVKEASEITIFYIDRKNDPNHKISLSYSHSMNLSMNSSKTKFDLITVIKDLPFNSDGSLSYIAYIRSLINHKWYSYDNKEIKLLQDENEVLDDKYASLLIYSPPKHN